MKKNLLSIIILALLIVNIVLTAIMMFSVVGASKKTSQLVTDIASVLKLEIDGVGASAAETRAVPLSQTEVYNISDLTIAMKSAEGDATTHYCLLNIALSIDTKGDGYKEYGAAETLATYETLISSEINAIISSYTVDEFKSPETRAEAKHKILENIQAMFDADFIYDVSIGDIKFS